MTRKLKFEGFQVGQTIRAYDFEPRQDAGECYIEGVIEAVLRDGTARLPYAHYCIRVTRDVWAGVDQPAGERSRVDDEGYVPMETSLFDWDGRVTSVPAPAAACPRCGGWTGFGGMSQYRDSKVPVMGRKGCGCH